MTTSWTYSKYSTPSIPNSCFWTHDFLLAASMVIIQPSSGKVVLVNDTELGTWFLPRGRKDIGETLEQCALREAYEEVRFS
jgi:ADP-ribose pyrophosphatase YjhB (NUDIX family)